MQQPPNQTKPKTKIEHLINWYHGNFCVKHKHCTREHYGELKKIALSWGIIGMNDTGGVGFASVIENSFRNLLEFSKQEI